MTQETITRDYCQDKTLLFYPQSEDETRFIQQSLYRLGYSWNDGSRNPTELRASTREGMVLENGRIDYLPDSDQRQRGTVCNGDQFYPPFSDFALKMLTCNGSAVQEMFNQMSAKIEALTNEVQTLKEEISFQSLGSDGMKPAKKTR